MELKLFLRFYFEGCGFFKVTEQLLLGDVIKMCKSDLINAACHAHLISFTSVVLYVENFQIQ